MKKDVNKILTECYKEGPHDQKFPRRLTNKLFDEVGGKVGVMYEHKRATKHQTKSFGENLSYLPRYLAANVGRKWDDIYSAISQNLDRRSATQEHIFQHLFDYLVLPEEVVFVGNKPHRRSNWGNIWPIYADGYKGMYVDPRTGILKHGMKSKHGKESYQEAKARKNREREFSVKRVLSKFVEMHKREDGFWYVFELKPVPQEVVVHYEFAQVFPRDYDGQQEWFKAKRRFEGLTKEGKVREGRRVEKRVEVKKFDGLVPYGYRSPLTEDKTIRVKGGKHYERQTVKATHYYASMRSASKKELRAAGL